MINIFHKKKKIPSKKVGLALGSGSARGWSHIGVIRALTEAGVRVDYVAGTSIGALVGAVYASGKIDALEEVVLQLDWKKIAYLFDVVFPKSGLIDGKKVSGFIQNHVKGINIEDLSLPFCAVSTDLTTGNEVAIKDGNIIEAVRASISIPGIFTPVKKNGTFIVDGGLVNPVPVSVVREMGADFVIAVDLNHNSIENTGSGKITDIDSNKKFLKKKNRLGQGENKVVDALNKRIKAVDFPALTHVKEWMNKEPMPSIFEVLTSSINIMEEQITAIKLKTDPPDILIQPNLGHLKFLEFNRAKEAIDEGYKVSRDKIKNF
ncbi:patatin-like phospholipase family protein [Desulfobacula sp.]|uniref:patatin-like phospholipase family protein n=1 Tax=Desulfobacula sp. TaxID=2593537 RepID=UPI002609664D|nr:patatin-like phospholipase family protein [Desulfobacula sp.]